MLRDFKKYIHIGLDDPFICVYHRILLVNKYFIILSLKIKNYLKVSLVKI